MKPLSKRKGIKAALPWVSAFGVEGYYRLAGFGVSGRFGFMGLGV